MTTIGTVLTQYPESVKAMANTRSQADKWTLADALLAEVPQGEPRSKFGAVRAAAELAGVKPLSQSALRQYRDTAAHWPPSRRIEGVSFTAHRAAMRADNHGSDGSRMLADLAAVEGASNVTVKHVEDALAVLRPNMPPAKVVNLDQVEAVDLARALAARWREDQDKTLRSLGTVGGPAGGSMLAQIGSMVEAVVGRKTQVDNKRAAWGSKTKAPVKAAAPVDDGAILGSVRR